MTIALIDYGAGNLHSVHNALIAAGAERVAVTSDPRIVRGARRIVLPGVGSFKACADGLNAIPGLVEALVTVGAVAPVLEAADDDRAVDEVDHRARAVHGDHLALADLAVRALGDVGFRLGHQRLSSSWAKRIHKWVLGSTSRIEVGATNRRSSVSSGLSSVAKYITGRGHTRS